MHAGHSNLSTLHAASRGCSFKTNSNSTSFRATHAKDNVPAFFQTSSAYDSIGTSIIDVDTAERVLPTSFIPALSMESKAQSTVERDTMSRISEMTYSPLLNQLDTDNASDACNSSGRPLTSHIPRRASMQARKPFNHISGDSEILHFQGNAPIIRTASVSRGVFLPGASVVGFAPATLCNVSGTKRYSSSVDTLSIDKSLRRSTYEFSDDLSDSKTFDSLSSFLPPTGTRRALRDKPAEPHFKATVMDPASTSLFSRLSVISLRSWKKNKPLPAVPQIPRTTGCAHRRREESASLSELISRAIALRDLLGKDQNPHSDVLSARSSAPCSIQGTGRLKPETISMAEVSLSHTIPSAKHQPAATDVSTSRKKRKIYFLIFFLLIVALGAIGAGIGVSVTSRQKQRLPACAGNFTGLACNLGNGFLPSLSISLINIPDTTCVCTSSDGCNGLAQAIVDLIPMVNQNFATSISLTSAYNSLWIMQGTPATSNCASQALLADIGKGNDEDLYPNHTQWAQTALLWNAIQTEDIDAAGQLQRFVQKIPWTSLGTSDGSASTVADSEPGFSTTVAGFVFNFASQTVTPPSASFVTLGQPTNAQISRVSSQTQSTLDRMYTFAQGMSFPVSSIVPLKQAKTASSIQHRTALKTYWTSVLLQPPQDLAGFMAALSVSPVLLPFNASSPSIRTLYSNSTSSLFPPPLACFPDLTSEVKQQINSVENGVFGLQPIANTTSEFDTSCYQDRPVYGVLDVLRLRLPFLDSQTGVVKQAVVLTRDANPRVVLHLGLMFDAAPKVTYTPASSQLDARQYGTLSLFDHVVLQYLTSMPDVNTASALVSFVLNAATNGSIPPDQSSPLFQSLQSIPFIEVAVFGDVGPPDLTSTVASFTTSSNALFFGSADGAHFRNWTINTIGGPVVWTENATSPLVVRDSSLGNTAITQTWDAVSLAISNNITGIGLANITTTLQGTQDFSP